MKEGFLMKNIGAALVCVGLVAVLTGCSSAGGSTTCKDFRAMDSKGQTSVITQMLKDQGNSSASPLKVSAYKLSAKAYCEVKSPDAMLSGMSGG